MLYDMQVDIIAQDPLILDKVPLWAVFTALADMAKSLGSDARLEHVVNSEFIIFPTATSVHGAYVTITPSAV